MTESSKLIQYDDGYLNKTQYSNLCYYLVYLHFGVRQLV